MSVKERIEMIEKWMRNKYGREDIYVNEVDPRVGRRYGIVIMQRSCVMTHLSAYLPLKELEAYVDGLLRAESLQRQCDAISK